mmetsp:Transcript_37209/g.89068  ORF Transcript_37209/g.89068 Transcript_37209/m.89068 type:complete len:259 (-) Transcript_37209:1885-2661(-)
MLSLVGVALGSAHLVKPFLSALPGSVSVELGQGGSTSLLSLVGFELEIVHLVKPSLSAHPGSVSAELDQGQNAFNHPPVGIGQQCQGQVRIPGVHSNYRMRKESVKVSRVTTCFFQCGYLVFGKLATGELENEVAEIERANDIGYPRVHCLQCVSDRPQLIDCVLTVQVFLHHQGLGVETPVPWDDSERSDGACRKVLEQSLWVFPERNQKRHLPLHESDDGIRCEERDRDHIEISLAFANHSVEPVQTEGVTFIVRV